MSDVKLPPTAYAVLGILSFGVPVSGYEIRQWALRTLGPFYWSPAQSQIYRELERLEEAGLVDQEAVAQARRPDKVVYSINEAGRSAIASWFATGPVPRPSLKHHMALRVFLSGTSDPRDLIALLEDHITDVRELLDELENQSVALGGDSTTRRAAAVAEWAAEIHRGDLAGAERVLKLLHGEPAE